MYQAFPTDSKVVQKYGGTSVGNPERIQAIARRIRNQVNQGWSKIAVVVSAMSGETNRLVSLVNEVNPKVSARSYDMAVAAGEQVSVGLLSAALEAEGLLAEPLLGYQLGIFTDDAHARARILSIQTNPIERAWEENKIPVIAGFQGVTPDFKITTLGRGGSDTSAVALAVALKASFCEINTDVNGVYTADPRIVKDARLIEEISYDVALELAASGGKVLHSRCVEMGAKYAMPVVVRNTFDTDDSRRTKMVDLKGMDALEAPLVSAVTLDKNVAKITLRNWKKGQGNLFDVFSKVAARGVNVDVIVYNQHSDSSTMNVGFTVPKSDLGLALETIETFKNEYHQDLFEIQSQAGLAKVSAVGLGMSSHPGVASRIFDAIHRAEIDILMVSTSEIKISFVIAENDGERLTQLIHSLFF